MTSDCNGHQCMQTRSSETWAFLKNIWELWLIASYQNPQWIPFVHECVFSPLRKQCQAVEGQEWDQAMSSSSEKEEDIEKTPDSDSLLAYCILKNNVNKLH